ncbi:SulP family inorganic anion transporter [Geobacter sulfurreducens]|uniref:SulP family inorganic anion transporter n=1 Tax=Geobacter sulfurreducens TaxID=35554 RepID=UPI000DBB5AA5|nr:sulfate permease [Geobacter sulfurreducens]BBA70754.1 putative sulfate transporter [Geobacter sulfurreducens]
MRLTPSFLLPEWLRSYRPADLLPDLAAGAVVAVVLAPQGMAYALLAGLPPIMGLYAATVPLLAYALAGSSRHLSVGPVAIVSLLVHVACSKVAPAGSAGYVAAALQLALLTGVLQLLLGSARAGFMVNFLSRAAIGGFTSAAAILIGMSQFKNLFGISGDGGESALELAAGVVRNLGTLHLLTTLMGLAAIGMLLLLQRFAPRFPAPLAAIVLGIPLTALLSLDKAGVRTVGDLPHGLPPLSMPPFAVDQMLTLLPAAVTIALIGYLESFAVAGLIADREKYRINPNRELVGLGIANAAAAFFSGYPVTGGFSRTAVNHRAGARTGLAGMITATLIGVILLHFTHLFHYLPKTILAAIVIVAVAGLVEAAEARYLFRVKPSDGYTFVLTFLVTLGFGVEAGIVAGVIFSLLVFIWRSAHPHIAELGWLEEEGVFRNIRRYPHAVVPRGMLLVRVDASLYFANMAFVGDWLRATLAERADVRQIIFDLSGVNDMDAVALAALEVIIEGHGERGIVVAFAGMKGPVRDLTQRAGWPEKFGKQIDFLSLNQAVRQMSTESTNSHGSSKEAATFSGPTTRPTG